MSIKLTVSKEQAKAIGRLTADDNVIYDAMSGVNLRETKPGDYITVPSGANLTNLKYLQKYGCFDVIEDVVLPRLAAFTGITLGGTGNKTVTLTFSDEVSSAGLAAADMIVLVDGVAVSGRSMPKIKNSLTGTITLAAAPTESVSVEIKASGALKIADVQGTEIATATKVYNIGAFIKSFLIEEVEGTIDNTAGTITIEVPFGTDVTTIEPVITVSAGAELDPASEEETDFTSPVTYTVTPENGEEKEYVVTVTTEAATGALITAFGIGAAVGVIDNEAGTIAIEVPFETVVTALEPVITVSAGATVDPASAEATDFTSPVTYIVTPEIGNTKEYVVTVTVAAE